MLGFQSTHKQPLNHNLKVLSCALPTQMLTPKQSLILNKMGWELFYNTTLYYHKLQLMGKRTNKIKKNTQASLKIASLNIRGRGPSGDSKWYHINQIMKEQHLGVLAVQEAHLTPNHVDSLHTLFGKWLQIHSSQGLNANAQGVAIVLNKDLTNIKGVEEQEIIPGRAMLITLPWHSDLSLRILNIYAPNAHSENQTSGKP